MNFICRQILDDISFLSSHRLMDYSLLLITEKNPDYQDWDQSQLSMSKHDSGSSALRNNALASNTNQLDRMTVIPEEADDDHDRTSIMNADPNDKQMPMLNSQRSDVQQKSLDHDSKMLEAIKDKAQSQERKLTHNENIVFSRRDTVQTSNGKWSIL